MALLTKLYGKNKNYFLPLNKKNKLNIKKNNTLPLPHTIG
jgi:hypothetical protein